MAAPPGDKDQSKGERQQLSDLLSHRYVFGYRSETKASLHCCEDNQILYPAGHTVVLYHPEKKTQNFFQGSLGAESISCLSVSPNQRYLAVAEKAC